MLSEGAIIQNLMLTRLLSKTPLACLFQAIDVDSGERFLARVARDEWLDQPGSIQSLGFDFRPGQALTWKPLPAEALLLETEFLKQVKGLHLPLPEPILCDEVDGVTFVTYKFFEGVTLDEIFESGAGFTIEILVQLLEEVDKLSVRGIFHGNLQPSTILIGKDSVLLTEIGQPLAVISGRQSKRLLRCITVPEFYPFLDPRHDQLAMGILLYTLVTGKHPLALEDFALRLDFARRAGPRLSALIDEGRERGANRFLSPLLSFLNPTEVKRGASEDFQELVLRTLGFSRSDPQNDGGFVEVLPDTWLDRLANGGKQGRDKTWTLHDTACALAQVFSLRQPAEEKQHKAPAARKGPGRRGSKTTRPPKEELDLGELSLAEVEKPNAINFSPEDELAADLPKPTPLAEQSEDQAALAPPPDQLEPQTVAPPEEDEVPEGSTDVLAEEREMPGQEEEEEEEEEEQTQPAPAADESVAGDDSAGEGKEDERDKEDTPPHPPSQEETQPAAPAAKTGDMEVLPQIEDESIAPANAHHSESDSGEVSQMQEDEEDSDLALVSELLAETLIAHEEGGESGDPSSQEK